jgi:hypothetical protein
MSPSFDPYRRKIDRAKLYVDSLEETFKRFTDAQRETVFSEFDAQTSTRRWIIDDPGQPDPEWSLRIGEILYQLWSTLDHLVYELVEVSGSTKHSNEHAFLIRSNRADFYCDSKSALRSVRPDLVDAIERAQPYNGWNGSGWNSLGRLFNLYNTDKHRHVHLIVVALEWLSGLNLPADMRIDGQPLKGRTVVASCPVTGPEDNVDPNITFGIFFGERPVRRYPTVFILRSFIENVERAVREIGLAAGFPPWV